MQPRRLPDTIRTNHLHHIDELIDHIHHHRTAAGPWGEPEASTSEATAGDDPWADTAPASTSALIDSEPDDPCTDLPSPTLTPRAPTS